MGYMYCIVCKSNSRDSTLNFHAFPKDECRRRAWLNACKLSEQQVKMKSTVCSKHFTSNDYNGDVLTKRKLKKGAIPIIEVNELVVQNKQLVKNTCPMLIVITSAGKHEDASESDDFKENCLDVGDVNEISYHDDGIKIEECITPTVTPTSPNVGDIAETSYHDDGIKIEECITVTPTSLDVGDVVETSYHDDGIKVEECITVTPTSLDVGDIAETSYHDDGIKIEESITVTPISQDVGGVAETSYYDDGIKVEERVTPTVTPPKRENIPKLPRYIGDLTAEHFGTPRRAEQNLAFIKRQVSMDKKKIRCLQKEKRKLEKCISSMKDLLQQLRKETVN